MVQKLLPQSGIALQRLAFSTFRLSTKKGKVSHFGRDRCRCCCAIGPRVSNMLLQALSQASD